MNKNEELIFLRKRTQELEKKMDNLRLSRRVLMDLLEQVEKEKNILTAKLDKKTKGTKGLYSSKKNSVKRVYSQDFELLELKNYIKK